MTDEQIKHMAERFLCWKLPVEQMTPDNGISIKRPNYAPNVAWEPVGTNLIDYTQAEAMVRHMLEGMPDPIVGHKTLTDGSHQPLRKSEADEIWARAEAAKEKRAADMPTERDAINQLWDAQERLKELGWKDPCYAPKDGSALDVIELGSTGIHRAHYEGEWPTGGWWIYDGDVWPCRPALARPAIAMEAASAGETCNRLDPKGDSAGRQASPKTIPGADQ